MSALIKSADLAPKEFNEEQLGLIKNIICKGASDDEIAVFLQICKHTRLDPLSKQIWMIPRWDSKLGKTVYWAGFLRMRRIIRSGTRIVFIYARNVLRTLLI